MGTGAEWVDEGLPIPSYLEHMNKGYMMGYEIDGYFGTQKGQEYLNDIIARFLITFAEQKPERLPHKPLLYSAKAHYYPKIYKLQELQKLKSLRKKVKAPVRADSFEDFVFWAIKLHCEDLIRSQNGILSYGQLEDFALSNFEGKKEKSTLRAKARSIFNWYEAKDFVLPYKRKTKTDEELRMTRQERAKKNTEERARKAKNQVINCVTGLMANTYLKKSGTWHIGMISKDTGLNRDTVSKYLRELKAEGTIA